MPTDNTDQIAEWNGVQGQRWASLQPDVDRIVRPFGHAALKAAAPQAGESVIDIGCGCGDTSIELARIVGASGAVLGVDVSQPMLEVARSLGELEHGVNLSFREADASAAELPAHTDLLYSRFGTMFFSDPTAAFAHLRNAVRPGGRCVFVCWRTPRDNPWAMTPLMAARQALNITPPPMDPAAPGPFAFADEQRLNAILTGAGFVGIDVQRFDAPVHLGNTPRAGAEGSLRIGPTSRLGREVGIEHEPLVLDAVERALGQLAAPDGQVRLNGSTWIVSASTPG
jgi:SAM-dependent methyltransferase